jgi:hypothetical protein
MSPVCASVNVILAARSRIDCARGRSGETGYHPARVAQEKKFSSWETAFIILIYGLDPPPPPPPLRVTPFSQGK